MAVPFFEHGHQPVVQPRIAVARAQVFRLAHRLGGVEPVDQVPGREFEEHLARHLAPLRPGVAKAELRHHAFEVQALVEIGAADVHAAGGQHVVGAVLACSSLGSDAHDGEVGGAAADVDDEHDRLFRDALLVVEGGCDRFELEADLAKARGARRVTQAFLGAFIAFRIVIHEMHGSPDHHALGRLAELAAGAHGQFAQEARDDVLEAHQAVVDRRLFLHQRAAEQALQRAHQAAFGAREVLADGVATEVGRAVFGVEEDRGGQGGGRAFDGQQASHAVDPAGHGGVGGAEVDADRRQRRR
ncbi:hypothetical protein D9M72_477310 [compost metagenome]